MRRSPRSLIQPCLAVRIFLEKEVFMNEQHTLRKASRLHRPAEDTTSWRSSG
jgi:hypothetical protein